MIDSPSGSSSALLQIDALLQQGKPEEAAAVCAKHLALSPHDATLTHLMGLARVRMGETAEGERLMGRSLELDPRNAEFRVNFANVLRRAGRFAEAELEYRKALRLAPDARKARHNLALTLDNLGRSADAEAEVRRLLEDHGQDPEAWSLLGYVLNRQGRLAEAEAAYRMALQFQPNYALAHHNLGSVLIQSDQAEEALSLLDQARRLGASGFEQLFSRGRALTLLYRLEEAEESFSHAVAARPGHIDAQFNLARLRFMRKDPEFARALIDAAGAMPGDFQLLSLLATVLYRAGNHRAAESRLRDALDKGGAPPQFRSLLARVLLDEGRLAEAEREALEAAGALPRDAESVDVLVSILLSRGRAEEAIPFIRAHRAQAPEVQSWIAHEAIAARLLKRPIYQHLFDYQRFVKSWRPEAPQGWSSMTELNAALAEALRSRHLLKAHPLDQSLRNGSQTTRNLITEQDPAIRAILQSFTEPLREYLSDIGKDPNHPFTMRNRGSASIAEGWSVQLHRGGFHVNHLHPKGWISSAYYVEVPEEVRDANLKSGWLKFGEPRYAVPGAVADHFVQPEAGLLVLFPSYLWHGTNLIQGADTRTTIAFDAMPVR